MNKSDDQLRSEIAANESSAEWGAWAVVFGLILEIVLATANSLGYGNKGVENWGAVVADSLIALGVYCEIHFGRRASHGNGELRRRSDERVAEANARAAEAQLALAKFRAPRREIFAGKGPLVTERLKPFSGTKFDCGTSGSGEVADFWWDLQPALIAAGWEHLPWFDDLLGGIYHRQPPLPISGIVGATNVEIHIRSEERMALAPAAEALVAALNDAGIAAADVGFNCHSKNVNALHIHIGEKQ